MLYVTFGKRSEKDKVFSINYNELTNGGILNRRATVKDGDRFNLKLVAINGAVVNQEFKASRVSSTNGKSATLMATDILSPYLFGEPVSMRYAGQVGVCSIVKLGANGQPKTVTARTTKHKETTTKLSSSRNGSYAGARPTKKAIKAALRAYAGNKTSAAAYFGVSPRTLGRWLEA